MSHENGERAAENILWIQHPTERKKHVPSMEMPLRKSNESYAMKGEQISKGTWLKSEE